MSNSWLRLWHDMPNDPKWRTIARISGEPISLVQAIYIHLLVDASRNVTRGHVTIVTEDIASALDVTDEQVDCVLNAMQGRVLDGDLVSGWTKRQPKNEDAGNAETGSKSATQRQRECRERKRANAENNACHEMSRDVTTDTDTDKEKDREAKQQRGSRLPADWSPSDVDVQFCKTERPDLNPAKTAERFRDYWISQAGSKGVKLNWSATWRNWVRAESRGAASNQTASQPACNPSLMPPGMKMSSHGAYT